MICSPTGLSSASPPSARMEGGGKDGVLGVDGIGGRLCALLPVFSHVRPRADLPLFCAASSARSRVGSGTA